MRAPGFFDREERIAKLDGLGDPLVKIAKVVDWERFRPVLDRAFLKPRKSNAGRKEYDRVLMFQVVVLQQLYNLSDEQVEYQIRDRYTFGRFLGLRLEDRVPDARTIWRYRERLKSSGALESLFAGFGTQIEEQGYIARKDQIEESGVQHSPTCMAQGELLPGISAGGGMSMENRRFLTGRVNKTGH